MAGIGFELRKIYKSKKLFSEQRMYLYAGVFYGGPLFLGVVLVMLVSAICVYAGMTKTERYLLTSMITYAVIFSLFFSNVFSALLGRYVSDMIYSKRYEKILPTFLGSSLLMVFLGEFAYGIFLAFSGISLGEMIFCLVLFAELVVLWSTINFITSIKEYKMVLYAFIVAVLVTVGIGILFILIGFKSTQGMLFSVCVGYGTILYNTIQVLYKTLPAPKEDITSFEFLRWFDMYPRLLFLGLGVYAGAFLHIISTWFTSNGVQIQGLFYNSPFYDVPAFYAFMTTIVSTINFSVFVEVEFYLKFKRYYWLYNNQGTWGDIKEAEKEMLIVLKNELKYLAWRQTFATIIVIFVGGQILEILPLGFNNLMLGYFRVLCLAYGVYGIAQSVMLVLLYFDDVNGASFCAITFGILNVIATIVNFYIPSIYYGFGFLICNIIFFILVVARLEKVTNRLPYMVLSRQPIVNREKEGIFSKFEKMLVRGGFDEKINQNKKRV